MKSLISKSILALFLSTVSLSSFAVMPIIYGNVKVKVVSYDCEGELVKVEMPNKVLKCLPYSAAGKPEINSLAYLGNLGDKEFVSISKTGN